MKHFGDITKLSGYTLPPVDCITGGSPCQDLSVVGLRKGLDGERSGLFMEQVRIVKEMRERDRRDGRPDHLCRPRYMVWENVPGAFSSNGGKDFQAVLTEIVRIAEPSAPDVPLPEGGRWSKAGCLYGMDGRWSIAWRVHDAQFWGVPQRRKRIALVADFGGMSAPEILFERTGLLWNPSQGGKERKGTAGGSEDSTGKAISFQERAGKPGGGKGILIQNEHTGALSTFNNQSVFCIQGAGVTSQNSQGSGINKDVSFTVNALDRHAVAYGFKPMQGSKAHGIGFEKEKAPTLNTSGDVASLVLNDQGGSVMSVSEELVGALRAEEHGHQPIVFDGSRRHDYEPFGDVCETVQASYGTGGGNTPIVMEPTVYNGANITSEINHSNPQPGDPCHTLHCDARNYVIEPICVEMTSTKNTVIEDGVSPTLTARMGTGGNQVNAICMDVGFFQTEEEKAGALLARQYKDPPITYQDKTGALMASGYQKNGTQEAANDMYVANNVVRRLTPLECERLQGYPDGWTNIGEWVDSKGKRHKDADSPRYKALGNSIAVGCASNASGFWMWLMKRISAQYERRATLGSLFDGIGGFPLAWETFNGRGSALWASEIEEFPIAVTKLRFPEEE